MQNAERLKSCQPVDKLLAEQSVAWWLNLKWSVEPPTVGGSWLDNYPVEKHWSQGVSMMFTSSVSRTFPGDLI